MKLTRVHISKVGEFQTESEQRYQAASSYKGAGLIKRKQSDGKRERTQVTLEKIEDRFTYLLRNEANLINLEFCRNERRERRKAERKAKRK